MTSKAVVVLACLISTCLTWAIEVDEFRNCLSVCDKRYRDCLRKTEGLWKDFHSNMKKIKSIANKCCMFRAASSAATEFDSYSACARVLCNARLWG